MSSTLYLVGETRSYLNTQPISEPAECQVYSPRRRENKELLYVNAELGGE